MYKIYADDTLIYDSTIEDYKIGKGNITLETGKSGSFVFSLYDDHFYYDRFVKLKTVITVYKSGRIVFRGRVLNDVTDYWNNKVLTCEGELGFLQDSIIRPFEYTGNHATLFRNFIQEHNTQVDKFKQFKIGEITVVDNNSYINRSSTEYANALSTLTGSLTESALGGHFYITHGDDGTDPIPTIHYLADFTNVATQVIEFGVNLKNYTKTVKAEEIATAIIPLGTQTESNNQRLTIAEVNGGVDYVYSPAAVADRGWIFKTVVWDDVVLPSNLKEKAEEYLEHVVNQSLTIELNAIDLHLLDRSIESFNVCDYVHVVSTPHKLDTVMLCNMQTMDLLKPENDTITLGYVSSKFTDASTYMANAVSTQGKEISSIKQGASSIELQVSNLDKNISQTLRVGADGVTVTDADGNSVTIAGSQIDASTIHTDDLNLSGRISFGDLDNNTKNLIEGKAEPSDVEYIASTVVTDALVASPTIIGGKFYAIGASAYTEMTNGGLYIYDGHSANPKFELTISDSNVQFVLGAGSDDASSSLGRFFVHKETNGVGLFYYTTSGQKVGFTFLDDGTIDVHGTLNN